MRQLLPDRLPKAPARPPGPVPGALALRPLGCRLGQGLERDQLEAGAAGLVCGTSPGHSRHQPVQWTTAGA